VALPGGAATDGYKIPQTNQNAARCALATSPSTRVANKTQHKESRNGSAQSQPYRYLIIRKIFIAG
jgi:hypothetical protein